jgi:Sulfatase-modifying factor enzyme 1
MDFGGRRLLDWCRHMGIVKCSLPALIFALVSCAATTTTTLAQNAPSAAAAPSAEPARPVPVLRPEARPDSVTAEVGERKRIDVLANDQGVPTDPDAVPEMKIEGTDICGTARIEGRYIVYQGGNECAGKQVEFDYSVFLQNEWVTSHVTIRVSARTSPCNIPGSSWRMIRIDGGHFDKQNAPPAIVDFTDLLTDTTFDVAPFCLMLEPVPSVDLDKFMASIPDDQRHEQFPEFFEATVSNPYANQGDSAPANNVSFRMAQAFAKQKAAAFERNVTLPTLSELIAAAWQLQDKRPADAETSIFIVSLRSGNLQWTSTSCDTASGPAGEFLTVGPSQNATGSLTRLCFEQSRRDHTGFRLVIR